MPVGTADREVAFLRDPSGHARGSSRSDLDLIEHVDRALEVLHGKWKVHLVFCMARGVRRHGKLLECLPGASKKAMTESLRALERDGVVARRIFPEVPARGRILADSAWLDDHRAARCACGMGRGARQRGHEGPLGRIAQRPSRKPAPIVTRGS